MIRFNHREIRKFREMKNISQKTASKNAGVSQQQWSKWEYGIQVPSAKNLCKIMNALNMPKINLLYIFTDEPETLDNREQLTI